jgi:hypothetical protein
MTALAPHRSLTADCARCSGLCCVVLPFARSADFAFDKPAGTRCRNLTPDARCSIHDRLREDGFPGCVAYDCYGAGQRVTELIVGIGGEATPDGAAELFGVVRALHELLAHVDVALSIVAAGRLRDDLVRCRTDLEAAADANPDDLARADVDTHRRRTGALLTQAAASARATSGEPPGRAVTARIRPGADLAGARLPGADLTAADLRGAVLVGADLRGSDLRLADLRAADLRGADLAGADLTTALFLMPPQLAGARGDPATRLPARLERPRHWQGTEPDSVDLT